MGVASQVMEVNVPVLQYAVELDLVNPSSHVGVHAEPCCCVELHVPRPPLAGALTPVHGLPSQVMGMKMPAEHLAVEADLVYP